MAPRKRVTLGSVCELAPAGRRRKGGEGIGWESVWGGGRSMGGGGMPPRVCWPAPMRVAPPAARVLAAVSSRCAACSSLPLGAIGAHGCYLGCWQVVADELWRARSALPDGSAPRVGWWGGVGVALDAGGRFWRRMAPPIGCASFVVGASGAVYWSAPEVLGGRAVALVAGPGAKGEPSSRMAHEFCGSGAIYSPLIRVCDVVHLFARRCCRGGLWASDARKV